MCQCRDNILLASTHPYPEHTKLMHIVCRILHRAWGLSVAYSCDPSPCTFNCHSPNATFMGFCRTRSNEGGGLAYVPPDALNSNWMFKEPAPLKPLGRDHAGYLAPFSPVPWGKCLLGTHPAHARRATFVSSILSLAPNLSTPWEVPQVDSTRPQTSRAKHLA